MFKKFQEYTLKFFYGETSSDSFTFFEAIFMILMLAELASPFIWIYAIFKIGFNPVTISWGVSTLTYWLTFGLGYYLSNSKPGINRVKYDKLSIEDKRFILKLSMILFLHLFSCGIMAIALPFIIIIAIFNVIFNGITKQVFPDPVKKKTSNELSNEYDSLIKD
jgi:hypothetical protein